MKKSSLRFWRINFTIFLAVIIIFVGCVNGLMEKSKKSPSEISAIGKKVVISKPSTKISEKINNKIEINNFAGIAVTNDNIKIQVLCYHSVKADPSLKSSIVDTVDSLRQNLQAIKDGGYTTLTISELNNYLNYNQPVPPKSVLLTFDDGYEDNYSVLFPLLKEFNMKATIFVIAKNLTVPGYLNEKQIKEMSDYGIDIQSHTYSHQQLAKLSYDEQYSEMKKSREILQDITRKPIFSIAYPCGSFNADTENIAKKLNYKLGFTINRGYIQRGDDLVLLNRTCIDYTYNYNNIKKLLQRSAK